MRSVAITMVVSVALSCESAPPVEPASDTGGASSSDGGGATSSSSGIAETTAADSTGPLPGTGSETGTTDEPGESSGESGEPLEGDVLQNDSWTPADSLVWQTWPGMNDCWASVFDAAPGQYPFEIVGAIAAVGDGDGVFGFEVGVWEVNNQGMPTVEIASRTIDIDGSTSALTEVDLSGLGLPVIGNNDEFALVMCHTEHMGSPSIAIDADGTVDGSRNWVLQQAMGDWVQSPEFFGTDGDFILRAVIMPQG